jgi:hypothetical protein
MPKHVWIAFFALSLTLLAWADPASVLPLPELIRPHRMAVKDGVLYVLQSNVRVVSFSLKDGRKLNAFGKLGQGPGEFAMLPGNIRVHGDRIFVGNEHQGAHFGLDGRFIAQYKPPVSGVLQPLGDSFFMFTMWVPKARSVAISQLLLLSGDMKKKKVLSQTEKPFSRSQGGSIMAVTSNSGSLSFRSQGPVDLTPPRDLLSGSDGSVLVLAETRDGETRFKVIEPAGQVKNEFTLTIPDVEVDDDVRRRLYNEKKRPFADFKAQYPDWEKEYKKLEFSYPKRLLPLDWIAVADGLIYLRTHRVEDGLAEYWVVDQKGAVLSRKMLPCKEMWTIEKGILYALEENQEEDVWELFAWPVT